MQKYVKDIDETTGACGRVGLGDDAEYYVREGFELRDVEQAYNGVWYLAGFAPLRPVEAIKDELNEWAYNAKCAVAYSGVYVTRAGVEYIFETDKESVAMINAVLASGVEQINWKVYKDGVPCLLALTQAQFQTIFAFAFTMINEAFTVEGDANERVSVMTDEQLRDDEYISAFKDTFTGLFAQIDKSISLDESISGGGGQ